MVVKIDTNEKFHVIKIEAAEFSANMTATLLEDLLSFSRMEVKNLIINGQDIQKPDNAAAEFLLDVHNRFVAENASFVLYGLNADVKKMFDQDDRFGGIQIVPTLSEASDIVYMEEIEREFNA